MGIYKMQSSVSSVAIWFRTLLSLPVRRVCLPKSVAPWIFAISFLATGIANAFTQVIISTSAPADTENKFVAYTLSQFRSEFKANPLAANTYSLKIFDVIPPYKPMTQIDLKSLVNEMVAQSSTTYLYGFADGQEYERAHDLDTIGKYMVLLGTAPERVECQGYFQSTAHEIYEQNFSSPTFLPLGGQ